MLTATFDEGVGANNQVFTLFYGDGVKPGRYPQAFNHYSLLRTLENLYGLRPLGNSLGGEIYDCCPCRNGQ